MMPFDHAVNTPLSKVVEIDDLLETVIEVAQRQGAGAAARVIGENWDRYSNTYPGQLLEALRALPGEAFIDNPGLVVAANYLQQLSLGTTPHRFEGDPQVFSQLPDDDDSLAAQLILLTGVTASERTRGMYAASKKAATEARRRLDAASDVEAGALRANLPHLLVQWGRSHELAGGGGGSAHYEYEEAYRIALATQQPQIGRRAASQLAWHLAERGRLIAAQTWVRRAAETGRTNQLYDGPLHLAAALLHIERNDRSAASAELELLNASALGDYWAAALWVRSAHVRTPAECTVLESDIVSELARVPPAVSSGAINARYLHAAWWRLGRVEERPGRGAAPGGGALDGLAAYRRGDFHAVLERVEKRTGPDINPRSRAAALLLSAAAALGLGRSSTAAALFERAHAIIEREGLYTTYQLIEVSHLEALADSIGAEVPVWADRRSADGAGQLATLSERQLQVLSLLTSKRSLPAIAAELFVSPNTLKTTLQRMYRKLGVNSREEAADLAQRAGIHAPHHGH